MARQSIGDLALQQGSTALVPTGGGTGSVPAVRARPTLDLLKGASQRAPVSWAMMMTSGAAMIGGGILASALLPLTFTVSMIATVCVSAGIGVAFLGGLKRHAELAPKPEPIMPIVDPKLLAERSRRLRALLSEPGVPAGGVTFEYLVRSSRWVQDAVLSTLLAMKNSGEVVEDLDLDTGQWVYRLSGDLGPSMSGSMTLDDRRHALPSAGEGAQ